VAAVDDCVGQVVDAVDRSPLRDNTIIVVTSDHGWQMGQKDYLFKNSPWEESTRVPLVIRAPGVTRPGGIVDHPVSLIDLYPTLVDLCGLKGDTRKNGEGAPLDGHSLRPFLENPAAKAWDGPEGALSMIYAGARSGNDPERQHWTIRTARWRYIRYNNGAEELYDHEKDSREWTNLAESPLYAEVKADLRRKLSEMRKPR
jgi:iduronate 2-sulfatase